MSEEQVLAPLRWRSCAFGDLSVHELQAIYRARQEVFTLEQQCLYLDADGLDDRSHHVAGWAEGVAVPIAYARIVQPGLKYEEPSIGRVITTSAGRGRGLGRELVRRAVEATQALHPGLGIRISAQSRLEAFYGDFGFVIVGERYLEDGILHTEMLLRGAAQGPAG
jgi:ElaA protein